MSFVKSSTTRKSSARTVAPAERNAVLVHARNLKMARSAHAYVRGNTRLFYEWLEKHGSAALPDGPSIWICGDCHIGNLGPVGNLAGDVEIQIRDLDQTVIGNPSHDLIRLGLSLAMAARGSDLPGVTTALMIERMIESYIQALDDAHADDHDDDELPGPLKVVMKSALARSWKHLANERLDDPTPRIPLGKRFWRLTDEEREAVVTLFEKQAVSRLATLVSSRPDDSRVSVMDAAYWMKGCSSLGRLRLAVVLGVGDEGAPDRQYCLVDIKEAIGAVAPRYSDAKMPRDAAVRVVEGARHLSPHLGERMVAGSLLGQSVFMRELLPQDLKVEIEHVSQSDATAVAGFLAGVVGKAHARQLDRKAAAEWKKTLANGWSKTLDAPSWLWSSVVDLVASHEAGYLDHCRRFALSDYKST